MTEDIMNPTTSNGRILNISDDPKMRHAISCTLTKAGFTITEAEGAAQALQEIEKGLPDLVLLDIALPGVGGHELCTKIRQQPRAAHLAVIFLSAGCLSAGAMTRELNNGADGYLNWPENPDFLAASIKSVLRLRQTEARLRESEQVRATFEQVAIGLGHLTLDGRWTWVNRRLCQILGYTQEELQRRECLDIACPEDQQTLIGQQQRILSGETESFASEQRFRRKDGSVFWASCTVSLTRNSRGEPQYFVVVLEDISIRKWTEENLLLIRAGIEGSGEAIAIADSDGCHPYHNKAFATMFGYRVEELPESLISIGLFADPAVGSAVSAVIMDGKSWVGEADMVARDGRRFPVELRADAIRNERGKRIGLIGVYTDITERKQAAEALKQSEARFRTLFEFAPDAIYLFDLQGNFVDGNKAAEELIGYPREEVIGKSLLTLKLLSQPDLDRVAKALLGYAQGESTGPTEYVLNRKDGRQVSVEIRAYPITLGKQSLVLGIGRDISQRRLLEGQLRQAQKMEAIGQLASGIAHDFNNMLAVIQGNADLLLLDADQLSSQAQEGLKHIIAASRRAANLTRQLLLFSRKQVMQSEPVALNDLIRNFTKMLARTIRENIKLECFYADPLPFVQVDPGMLEQVLLNLVVNARDAMPHGGHLQITTEKHSLGSSHVEAHPEARVGEFVCLSVSDTGTGIAKENLLRIFEPFFTTKEPDLGTGLGLATVFGIVKKHGGWIELSSQVGVGTRFNIFLPVIQAPPLNAGVGEAETKVRGGTERILLVEDDFALLTLTQRLLESAGYQVLKAATADEGLELWRTRESEVDLLLTDLLTPGTLTGRQLAERLQQEKPQLKVIFMSGYSPAAACGQTDFVYRKKAPFLQKPCGSRTVLERVRSCLDDQTTPETSKL